FEGVISNFKDEGVLVFILKPADSRIKNVIVPYDEPTLQRIECVVSTKHRGKIVLEDVDPETLLMNDVTEATRYEISKILFNTFAIIIPNIYATFPENIEPGKNPEFNSKALETKRVPLASWERLYGSESKLESEKNKLQR